jgi:hypothetical protein
MAAHSNGSLPVTLLAAQNNTLTLIAEIEFPTALFANSTTSKIFDVAPVPDSEIFAVNGSAIWGPNTTYSESIMSAVLRLSFIGKSPV